MPFRSKAQSAMFHAAANNPAVAKKVGLPQATAKKFVADSAGQKTRNLPEHVTHKAHGGRAFTMKPKATEW